MTVAFCRQHGADVIIRGVRNGSDLGHEYQLAAAWPGGQALARYVLDNPALVRGRKCLIELSHRLR